MERQLLHELFDGTNAATYTVQPGYKNTTLSKKELVQPEISLCTTNLIGNSIAMQNIYKLVSRVAYSNSTVMILGETGTGKELIASGIHKESSRCKMPMVKINCAALPHNLIESELFGHERGSFTGANDRRIGKFEVAHNSTLFLDEIGELPLEMQGKLLRVIQEREFERIGGQSTIKVNVRLIVATNRNLIDEVHAGRFRADLFYRLNVFPIQLPRLRDRPEDIAQLAMFFLSRYAEHNGKEITSISDKVISELKQYAWPGNVRQLEHLIERSVLLTCGNELNEISLPQITYEINDNIAKGSGDILQDKERSYIIDILKKYRGKVAGSNGAAGFLSMRPTTLHSKMKKMGISKFDYFSRDV